MKNSEDAEKCMKAVEEEIKSLSEMQTWNIVDRPKDKPVVNPKHTPNTRKIPKLQFFTRKITFFSWTLQTCFPIFPSHFSYFPNQICNTFTSFIKNFFICRLFKLFKFIF
jgi:hypothetical protein